VLGAISGFIAALTSSGPQTPANGRARCQPAPAPVKRLLAVTALVRHQPDHGVVVGRQGPCGGGHRPGSGVSSEVSTRPQRAAIAWQVTGRIRRHAPAAGAVRGRTSRFRERESLLAAGMYRNRLVRAYLGASNCAKDGVEQRVPDPFTGFALNDNLALHEFVLSAAPPGQPRTSLHRSAGCPSSTPP